MGVPVPVPVPVPDRHRTFRGALMFTRLGSFQMQFVRALPLLILRWRAVRPPTADCRANCLFLSWSHDGLRCGRAGGVSLVLLVQYFVQNLLSLIQGQYYVCRR